MYGTFLLYLKEKKKILLSTEKNTIKAKHANLSFSCARGYWLKIISSFGFSETNLKWTWTTELHTIYLFGLKWNPIIKLRTLITLFYLVFCHNGLSSFVKISLKNHLMKNWTFLKIETSNHFAVKFFCKIVFFHVDQRVQIECRKWMRQFILKDQFWNGRTKSKNCFNDLVEVSKCLVIIIIQLFPK